MEQTIFDIEHPEAERYDAIDRSMMRQIGVTVAPPEPIQRDEQALREYAESRGIDWVDVEATQRLINALIMANVGTDRVQMQRVIDYHNDNGYNFLRPFINAHELGITGAEMVNGMRQDFIDCLCGVRFDLPPEQEETLPSSDDGQRVK